VIGRVNEVDTTQHQLAALTSKLDKLMTRGPSVRIVCGIRCMKGHPTDACPTLQEENVNAIFNHQPRKYTLTPTLTMRVGETTLILGTDHIIH